MPSRRRIVLDSIRIASMFAAAGLLPRAASAWSAKAFEAKGLADTVKALGGGTPVESRDITITAQEIVENGAVVPIEFSTTLPGVKRMALLVEKNPYTLAAVCQLGEGVEPNVALRVKMAESSNVYVVAMLADGRVFFARRDIKVTIGGCGGVENESAKQSAPGATRIRAQAGADRTVVRMLMRHDMESGQRKDASGKTLPPWHIQDVTVSVGGKTVLTAEWGPSVAKDPFLQFSMRGAKSGEKVAVSWKDNRGDTRADEATIA